MVTKTTLFYIIPFAALNVAFLVGVTSILSNTVTTDSNGWLASVDPKISQFTKAVKAAYDQDVCIKNTERGKLRTFDLSAWDQQSNGGLYDEDRMMVAKYYGEANSVFEWGLGESSYIAGHLDVPRYAGVDSDATWVSAARDNCPDHFRFSFADIGTTGDWGFPTEQLQKAEYNYIIAPLNAELCPFDVYMVDGRFRVACGLMALLHASRHGHDATILMHDYHGDDDRREYNEVEKVCDVIEFSGVKLVALKRKPNVTDAEIYEMYMNVRDRVW